MCNKEKHCSAYLVGKAMRNVKAVLNRLCLLHVMKWIHCIFTVSLKIQYRLSFGITMKSPEKAVSQDVYCFFSCSSRDIFFSVLDLQLIRSMVWVRSKKNITLFLACCLPIPLIGSRWLVSVLSCFLWWLLMLKGKLMCKGTWKSPLLPTVCAQDKAQGLPRTVTSRNSRATLRARNSADWLEWKCSVCIRRPLVIGWQGGIFKK